MKRSISVSVLFILAVSVVSVTGIFISCKSLDYAQPDFERPNTYVIDSYTASGSLEDRIRIYNQTSNTGISFRIYYHNPSTDMWMVYGTGDLKGVGDTAFINSPVSGDLGNYRYFAIEALDENDYVYSFYKRRNDLHISISDKF